MAKTRAEINIDYAKRSLKRIPLDVQKEQYEIIKAHAEKQGETVNGFIKRAIREAMERDAKNDFRHIEGRLEEFRFDESFEMTVEFYTDTKTDTCYAVGRDGSEEIEFIAKCFDYPDK